ncbi:AP-5 complex subunit zeta-1 isoform X2 [Calypte anna]|uniref:AP-5 complex subunit zeta-1 isoform X2 n=1 Tax=Calypte anna TaxID=9244 RepID=UPI0011C46965|nr:AP-5 complex subunit zeta-1 isoform X2 [Calypte anna]
MFTAAAESFLRQAREIQEEELRRFASRVAALLQAPNPGPEAVDCLQRLHLTIAATKYPRKLDGKFVELLKTMLCSSKSPEQIQVLCAAILREMSPCNDLTLSCDEIQDTKLLSLVSSILLAQGNKADVSAVGQHVVRVLERKLPEGQNARSLLPVLSNVISVLPESFTEGDRSGLEKPGMAMVSTAAPSGHLLPPKEHLQEKAFEYCQRLIEQSSRRPLKKDDGDLQKACLIEAVKIMDIICKQNSSYVSRAVSFLKILHGRICGDATYARVLLPIAQFFLNHSKMAAVDCSGIYKHLFSDIPAQLFHNPSLAFEFLQFCKDNSQLFTEASSIFRQSFPNLFKFLAWNSPPLISEFVDLLPFLLDAGTAVEIFHLLLDLPCLTAALDIQLRSSALPTSEKSSCNPAMKPATCLEAFHHPLYKNPFEYLLRTKSAPEDAPERLIPLRQLLGSLASSPRVVQCAETVPVLLELFFRVVVEFADKGLINQLVVLLLQRSDQLYEIPAFKDDVYRVLSSQLVVLCKLHPALIVELSSEILEFSGTVSNIQDKEAIFIHLVWAIGEFLSVSCDKRCTGEQITRFFETLEVVLFEITQLRPVASTPHYPPCAITALMVTLAKLAARSQDLIPRVSIFLSKMKTFVQNPAVTSVYCKEDLEEILTRATELMNLLKMPSLAHFVFTPPVGVASTGFQREVTDTLPSALGIVTRLLQPAPGFVPG